MNGLETNLHSQILMSLAEVLADGRAKATVTEVAKLVAKCPAVPLDNIGERSIFTKKQAPKLGILNRRSQHAIEALVAYAAQTSKSCSDELLSTLLAYLRYLPAYEWDENVLLDDPPPVDCITFSLVSCLLEISYRQPDHQEDIFAAIWSYRQCIIDQAEHDSDHTVTFILPSLAGFSRALQLSLYFRTTDHLRRLCTNSRLLLKENALESIRQAIRICLNEDDPSTYSRRVLCWYWKKGVPLSSNRIVYDMFIIIRNVMARTIANLPPEKQVQNFAGKPHLTAPIENVWSALMNKSVGGDLCPAGGEELKTQLGEVYVLSLEYFEDTRKMLNERNEKWSRDDYIVEIMGTSLQVAALSSVYLHVVDGLLLKYIAQCIGKEPHVPDAWAHVASLDVATLLAINFPELNSKMTHLICNFLVSPSSAFTLLIDNEDTKSLNVQLFAVNRLAQCIKSNTTTQKSQTALSTLNALINEITRCSKADESVQHSIFGTHNSIFNDLGPAKLSESQKQQVCMNALSAIVGIAECLNDDSINRQACSMLILRRKSLSPPVLSFMVKRIVDLALASSSKVFQEIIALLSTMSREYLLVDDKQIATVILEAQLEIAMKMPTRPELYQAYLQNLLALFIDNGNIIQRRIKEKSERRSSIPLQAKLGDLLRVLRVLMEHEDFNPHIEPSEETVSLFRDMWFHCTMFGFVSESMWAHMWYESLLWVAKKTPVLIIDSATSYLESDLEYNSVLRSGECKMLHQSIRDKIARCLPLLAYDCKSYSFAQAIFTLSIYHIETMRCKMGDCSFIWKYFMNEDVNKSNYARCLEIIGDRAINIYLEEASRKASMQALEPGLHCQMVQLLKLCCHRLQKVHDLAMKTTELIVAMFPQVFADKTVMTLLLELLQLLWLSCEAEYRDEYSPVFCFESPKINVKLDLGDSYAYRKELCSRFYKQAKKWLHMSMECAPLEINGLLQDYLAEFDRFVSNTSIDTVHLGRSLALEVGKAAAKNQLAVEFVPKLPMVDLDDASNFVNGFTTRRYYTGEINGIEGVTELQGEIYKQPVKNEGGVLQQKANSLLSSLKSYMEDIKHKRSFSFEHLRSTMFRAAACVIALPVIHPDLVSNLVKIPVLVFTPESLLIGTDIWNWLLIERPDIEKRLLVEMLSMWGWAQMHRKGLFSPILNSEHPFERKMTYKPSDKAVREQNQNTAAFVFKPHVIWIMFLKSRFFAMRHRRKYLINMFVRLLQDSFQNSHLMSTHPLSRHSRFQLIHLGFKVLEATHLEAYAAYRFRSLVYDAAFNWFSLAPRWHYGARRSLSLREYRLLSSVYNVVSQDISSFSYTVTSLPVNANSAISSGLYKFTRDKTRDDVAVQQKTAKKLLLLLLDNELTRMAAWMNPLNATGSGYLSGERPEAAVFSEDEWKNIMRFAWETCPKMAVQMGTRFMQPAVQQELHRLIANNTLDVVDVPEALTMLLGERLQPHANLELKYLKYWAPVPTIAAANYFLPEYGYHPLILQYAMRSLEYYPVDTVFFYVPQIVQALRFDKHGYVERYIMEAGAVSQLFAHQIIWNMQANFYIDADKECIKPDPLKPCLERIIGNLVSSFTGDDRLFYEREFKFFGEVTAISGYLKEYIKYGQSEKKPLQKKRLDEELAKIKVDVGVYLPSNPDGRVVDINRTSGRPLQSHAKAPFMATFLIERENELVDSPATLDQSMSAQKGESNIQEIGRDNDEDDSRIENVWQGAIFKVGDDCRQDVLALQLIAVFKNIFTSVGLDLYVYPYRVVATAPGRGVIDVIPSSISRDQLGREKVNSLFDYFVAKYGDPSSIRYQRARTNFVQSTAAYSVISYLLQIKDRHNGNIMLDDDGHLIHIDFGFIFDIAPGGITFESSPFKLTEEMVQVMGGNSDQQPYKEFSELVVKAYLASRPFAKLIMQLVTLMLQSGLPCFRGDTIRRMQTRFQTDKTERVAADFMAQRIRDSTRNQRTVLYDRFQKLTNGIPY